jgi:NADP-dependent 3-hydroxy acid dehydrogenase YdfG
MMNTNNNFQ